MNWQKITIWTLILSLIIYLLFYYIASHTDKFCYEDHWDCYLKLRFAISFSFINLLEYIIPILLIVASLPSRYQRKMYISFIFVSVLVFIFVFILLPYECTGYMCFDKASGARFARNLYPLVLIPILVINFFRFRRQDKKLLLNK